MRHEINRIQRKDHNLWTYRINKICLSCYNDKKYTLKDRYLEITIEIRQIQIERKKKKEYRKLLL